MTGLLRRKLALAFLATCFVTVFAPYIVRVTQRHLLAATSTGEISLIVAGTGIMCTVWFVCLLILWHEAYRSWRESSAPLD